MRRLILVLSLVLTSLSTASAREQWTEAQAQAWAAKKPWLVGCNYIPSTAINQLEMWQADTFDTATIDKELGWAQELGFTSVRVFLHNLLWTQDKEGFIVRVDQFLGIAAKHHIGVLFVLLDACWDPDPQLGKQREPRARIHNSGWVQAPGVKVLFDPSMHDTLKPYITLLITHFKDDPRIDGWDLFNEPDNRNDPAYIKLEPANKPFLSLQLLTKAFAWARDANPSQPLTSGVWIGNWGDASKLSPMEKLQLGQSDVISFHNYSKVDELQKCVENLRRYKRPILCTEYMARPVGSTFDPNLGYMKEQRIGAYNWGFVEGKTQTIYPWDSWTKTYTDEPKVWFHDIFHRDGTPYIPKEIETIKSLTAK